MPRRTKRYTVKLTSEGLVNWFLAEALAVIAAHDHYTSAAEALQRYFGLFQHLGGPSDFQLQRTLPRPVPLGLFVDRYALYGHFRAWLRSHELDPDAVATLDAW